MSVNETQNMAHDVTSYEKRDQERAIHDIELLCESFQRSQKNSSWKHSSQKFEIAYFLKLQRISRYLQEENYKFHKPNEFILHERGKIRPISGDAIEDRVVKHALCDEYLNPALKAKLIYDNGASLTGLGISHTRRRLITHLSKFYRENKSNDGYILLIDCSKYFDNIRHEVLLEDIQELVPEEAVRLFKRILKEHRIDVSAFSEEEREQMDNGIFDSNTFRKDARSYCKDETAFLDKHMNIGDQTSQICGVFYRRYFDNYFKIVCGEKYYGGYMDDTYIIHRSKEHLEEQLKTFVKLANEIGVHVNLKKTKIVKLSSKWKFLQILYSMNENGRIITELNPRNIVRMRRKMKKVRRHLPDKEFENWFWSWYNNYKKYLSFEQKMNIKDLYYSLKEKKNNGQIYFSIGQ